MPSSRRVKAASTTDRKNGCETESSDDEPRRTGRIKVRDTMTHKMSVNQPRPSDLDLVPPTVLSVEHNNQQNIEESPRRKGRVIRRESMPLQSSFKDMPKPRPLDPTLFPIVMAIHDSYEEAEPRSGRAKSRESMPTGRYCDNVADAPCSLPGMSRQHAIRRKSNDNSEWQPDHHPSDVPAIGSGVLRDSCQGSSKYNESAYDDFATRPEPRRAGRMSRRSSM